MDERERIIEEEMFKTMRESAQAKADDGYVLFSDGINSALSEFISGYDIYVAFWEQGGPNNPAIAEG
jgi:hypothetical protein